MENNQKHKFVVVDDHPLFRRGVVQLLGMDSSIEVVAEAGDFDDALRAVVTQDPDVVLLDLNMKGTSGLQILTAVKKHDPSIRVIMLTVSDSPSDLIECLKAGADGYLLKDQEPEDILENIKKALEGSTVLSPALTSALAESLKSNFSNREKDFRSLTDREKEVLLAISHGQSNKQIAKQFNISDGTVKVHVKHVLRKLNFHSRVEAAIWMNEFLRNHPL